MICSMLVTDSTSAMSSAVPRNFIYLHFIHVPMYMVKVKHKAILEDIVHYLLVSH